MNKLLFLLTAFSGIIMAQQDQQLFHMHHLGESNFMNPAVQSDCKWFIGIPVLSSVHFNYANSGLSYNQLIENNGNGTIEIDVDGVVDRMGRRTLVATEFHTTLLALGHKRNEYYYAFSVIEKNNIPFTLSKDMVLLALKGNSRFEGEEANLKGTSIYAAHYREYALGISKQDDWGNYWGIKAKLLFGKLNLSAPKTDVSLYTDENYYALTLDGKVKVNMSAPVSIDHSDGQISGIEAEDVNITRLLMNRKNWGLAFDIGFIHRQNEKITYSGSILDIGFIRWRSNLNNISANENFVYEGVLHDTTQILESIMDSVDFDVTQDPYTTFLPLKAYLGANYQLNDKTAAQALASAVVYKTKFVPAITFSLSYNPFKNLHLSGSYSLMYRAYNNFGIGLSTGRNPLQFYIISDNIAGMIWPKSARNINLRFGLNINLGCKEKKEKPDKISSATFICPVYEKESVRRRRKMKWK